MIKLKFFIVFIFAVFLSGCGASYSPLTAEKMSAINNASQRNLASAQEEMQALKSEAKRNGYSEENAAKYSKARCVFLRESEYLYSDYSNIPCYVNTLILKEPEAGYISRANSTLVQDFKDPDSVKFRNIFLSQIDVPIVCGEVNAKNSYGGYTGFKKYYATDTKNFGKVDDGSGKFTEIWERYCRR